VEIGATSVGIGWPLEAQEANTQPASIPIAIRAEARIISNRVDCPGDDTSRLESYEIVDLFVPGTRLVPAVRQSPHSP
jgi:hypothetical protein